MPDPELIERRRRRRFSAEYKLKIVRQTGACSRPGEIGALLRREGLYSSLLTEWRRARDSRYVGVGAVGPLIEVPVLVGLVYVALWARRFFPLRDTALDQGAQAAPAGGT